MADIFDNTIVCKKCKKEMEKSLVSKNGFNLRIVKCDKCGETIVHPSDEQEYKEFIKLKNKDYEVKMRMVGNSYAVSIPREIVDFMKEQEKMINDMVHLSLEEAGRIGLRFNMPEGRVVRSREVRVIKNNKPVFHARQFSDSANPDKNETKVFKREGDEELDGR